MHETAICAKIKKEALDRTNNRPIKSITIEVGELAPLPPETLKQHLHTLTNWKVILKIKKASAICACKYAGPPTILERGHDYCLYLCPKCGRVPKLTQGELIIIKGVTI